MGNLRSAKRHLKPLHIWRAKEKAKKQQELSKPLTFSIPTLDKLQEFQNDEFLLGVVEDALAKEKRESSS